MTYNPLIQQSPNGGIENGAYLGATSDFVVINTLINHATGDIGGDPQDTTALDQVVLPTVQENLQMLAQMIQMTTNMKYINVTSSVVDLSQSANRTALGFGTNFNQASTTVYTIKFMAEQVDFFNVPAFNTLIEGVSVPLATTAVPSSTGNVTLSAYEVVDAAATNTVVTKFNLGLNGY